MYVVLPPVPLFCSIGLYLCFGSGVHVQIIQDCYTGTHMAMWLATSIPLLPTSGISTHVIPPLPSYPPPSLSLLWSPTPQKTPVCDAPLPVSMCSYCSTPTYKNKWCLICCSCVSLLKIVVSRFIHVPTKDMISLFLRAA